MKQKEIHGHCSVSRYINLNEPVYAVNLSKGAKWIPGFVMQVDNKMFVILMTNGRFVDQIKFRHCGIKNSVIDASEGLQLNLLSHK